MYWPVGAPKAYALSKHATSSSTAEQSEDSLHERHNGATEDASEQTADTEKNAIATGTTTNGVHNAQEQNASDIENHILAARPSRNGQMFATITRTAVTAWQARPVVALAAVIRSVKSMQAYGPNVDLLVRPDGTVIIVQTALGYLITYTLTTESNTQIYRTQLPESSRHSRRSSTADGSSSYARNDGFPEPGAASSSGIREAMLRFRMVIRIDAGISKALALDDALLVATQKPAAMQYIRWATEEGTPQTSTELLGRLSWYTSSGSISDMVHDRPMNVLCWIADDGSAYAVQRRQAREQQPNAQNPVFSGFCFRQPADEHDLAIKTAINARFSLIAVGSTTGRIDVYVVKDYSGNIPFSHDHQLPIATSITGDLVQLIYSPDGHCLFAGFEKGWAMWSVYGTALANSFAAESEPTSSNDEKWLLGVRSAFWLGNGCQLAIVAPRDDRIWMLDVARSAATGCLSPPNVSKGLLYTGSTIILYKGQDTSDLSALSSDASLLETTQVPKHYSIAQWPVRTAAISPDDKYVAVAGSRGLAHYSVVSGRWKTFDDPAVEDQFVVRGGMCWFQHFLIAAVESGSKYYLRAYSREKTLGRPLYEEELSAPVILLTMSGHDSLLVYTYDNFLLHYIVAISGSSVKLVQVGQIGFHGIIRAPPRVRAISWILPEDQLEHGDPSQDVARATVLFLVDGKLVLLQPSSNERGELKYDMRVIAQNVEYFILQRDQANALAAPDTIDTTPNNELGGGLGHSLRDSLWYFDGDCYHVWSDIHDVLASAPNELGRDLPATVRVPVDFYPVSAMVSKGIVNGLDTELVQRRDVNFSFFRHLTRTQLFLPRLLRHHLAEYNSPAALHLASSYQDLPYFAHALEILLHDVLDSEVDSPPTPPETALLPTVVSFLSSYPAYLDVVVNCTRKTELRSWRTLFACLPPVQQLFEQSLELGKLKTAAGYLLVLHALEQDQEGLQVYEFARLLCRAASEQDWELCGELARFLVGIDGSGDALRSVLAQSGLGNGQNGSVVPQMPGHAQGRAARGSIAALVNPQAAQRQVDYFSLGVDS
ncbi:WD40 repeat protein [Recurvomyces mirabilis]|uniref:WD40 repeat protein n=1 Tax=Recurvomyces mirabilis TaxID=574656 RepID=A0AAE0WGR0_9PEZI|nr:WD40 repeat protein [Recurvomyces mirabilis]KAK5159756.1 WD40 repeat protein [Recurvomyces mirabilis]